MTTIQDHTALAQVVPGILVVAEDHQVVAEEAEEDNNLYTLPILILN
jgi:hypothetical protein